MSEFFDEKIEVEMAGDFPRPVRFTWRGEVHEVAAILAEHVDTGFGMLPPRSRKWYTRRHRRYYTVMDSAGVVFDMYLDYADRKNKTWWLIKRVMRNEVA
ncbi:MAG: DUF6504 family protein [Armatimonadota bacterium]|nr:DUF6504 family protein [Armatimonadota bacterium]